MATITFYRRWRTTPLRERLGTLLSAWRDVVDRFISDRMRHAACASEKVRRRRDAPPAPPADQTEASAARFAPLGRDVLSETIPAFYIGRNKAGLWVVREAKGRTGGMFLLRSSALSFARARGGTAGCATIFPSERIELDLVNEGNPFASGLGRLMRLATAAL